MSKLIISNEWWTAPAEADNGRVILVTGRRDMDNVIKTGKFVYRVEVTLPYEADAKGLPREREARLMGEVHEALAPFDVLPLQFHAEEDPDWAEYREMCLAEVGASDV